jgi:hypothetical protein
MNSGADIALHYQGAGPYPLAPTSYHVRGFPPVPG